MDNDFFQEQREQSLIKARIVAKYFAAWTQVILATQKRYPDRVQRMSYQHFYNLIGNLTELIVKENDWQPMIDTVWNNRQLEDYNGQNLTARDFLRKWTHSRTAEHHRR